MLRQYELMVVLRPDFPTDSDTIRENMVANLLSGSGSVKNISVWGKRALAYPIKKLHEGVYMVVTIEAERLILSDVEKKARSSNDVLRYLLLAKG